MDDEMAAAALKIQNTFRGKKFGKRKGASDEETFEDQSSSANDSGEQNSNGNSQDEEKSIADGIERSFDRPQSYSQFNSDENNSRTASAVFSSEQSPMETLCREDSEFNASIPKDDTFDESNNLLTSSGGSGEDKDFNKNSRDRFFMSAEDENKESKNSREYSPETGELIQSGESIENIDLSQTKNSAEAMFYSLKKDELESQRLLSENIDEDEDSMLSELVKVDKVSAGKLPRGGMSLDERKLYKDKLLGLSDSILSQEYPIKPEDSSEEFDPFSQASKKKDEFLSQMHGRSSDKNFNEMEVGEEDQFDDFYPGNIRQKMLASSISIADSDYYDPNKIPAIDDDIKTALETINSSDSESTINSAATKIQAGARGFITRRRLHSTNASTSQYASFGNAAIDKSLDDFIERQEQLKEEDEEDETEISSKSSKKLDSVEDSIDESDDKNFGKGVIEIKLEQKKPEEIRKISEEISPSRRASNLLYADTAIRRMMLHREDAIQRNSTPSSDESVKSPQASTEKFTEKSSSTQETVVDQRQSSAKRRTTEGEYS